MTDALPVVPMSTSRVRHYTMPPYTKETRDEYRAVEAWLRRCHEAGMLEQHAVTLTPEQGAIVYAKAYADGHASGYYEIENQYIDLVDMVEKILAL